MTQMEVSSSEAPTLDEQVATAEAVIASEDSSEEAIKGKEQAIMKLGELYALQGSGEKLARLMKSLRPFFALIPKAKTAKVVRTLIDSVAKIPNSMTLQMSMCRESIEWCVAEKRSFLRQRIQTRLAALLLASKQYTEALSLLAALQGEVKKLDDKPQLVEINLVESQTHYALRNVPKSKAALTAARTAANAIYCPPLLQAQIDVMAGTLNAEEKDFKTAFSYFYEVCVLLSHSPTSHSRPHFPRVTPHTSHPILPHPSPARPSFFQSFENFDSVSSERAIDCLKYMLLCKIMMNSPEDVNAVIEGKPGQRHAGPELEAMRAVANAHQQRSLKEFEEALATHKKELAADPIIESHLSSLYGLLMQENICRILEPYSKVETAHIATLMNLPLATVEEKLSQMILDKKFRGILDAGAGCLIVYEDQPVEETYEQCLEVLGNMGHVVNALHEKANKLDSKQAIKGKGNKEEEADSKAESKDKKEEAKEKA